MGRGPIPIPPGSVIDDGDDCWGLVIYPSWTDGDIAAHWAGTIGMVPEGSTFTRRTLFAHSARQLRNDPKVYDQWFSEEGELKTSIVVAEIVKPGGDA